MSLSDSDLELICRALDFYAWHCKAERDAANYLNDRLSWLGGKPFTAKQAYELLTYNIHACKEK